MWQRAFGRLTCYHRPMIWTLYWLILSMMVSLVPTDSPVLRHGSLATALATVLYENPPLYARDEDRTRTAALMVAIAYRESSLDNSAVGDHGRSVCAFQIHMGPKTLLDDPLACSRAAYALLRASIAADREHPVAHYARGPKFRSLEAQKISNDRVFIAERLAKRAR